MLLQRRHRETRSTTPVTPPLVTLSRQMGSDGGEIAEALRAALGGPWQVWDSALLDEVARRSDRRRQLIEAIDEKVQSNIDLMIRSMVGAPVVEEAIYLRHLKRVLLTLAHEGHAIIVGRGGSFVLRDALKVRLRAPLPVRIETCCRTFGWTREEAERRIHASDHERAQFIRTEFERDIEDPDAYDMLLRTEGRGAAVSPPPTPLVQREKGRSPASSAGRYRRLSGNPMPRVGSDLRSQ
jgi:hypothetical protein